MAQKYHEIASSVKGNYLRLDRLTDFDSSVTLWRVRGRRRRIGPTSLYCNRLSPRFMWMDPPPYGLPHSSGPNSCDELTRFAGRGCKTRRCGCARRSTPGRMTKEFFASRGAVAQYVKGGVSCGHGCRTAPWRIVNSCLTRRALG